MKIERLTKQELNKLCVDNGISIKGKTKSQLCDEAIELQKEEVRQAIDAGEGNELLKAKIFDLANEYATILSYKINTRKEEMRNDDNSHYLIYMVLGISSEDGGLIDEYQNTGRFLYKYAGSFLEEAASLCLLFKNPNGGKIRVDNNEGTKPKTFEIDFLDGNDAVEIKWRDATTDGDHITKEHTRVKVISSYGYKPIRVMFYYPLRTQAIKIQETLKTIYKGCSGEYFSGDDAWEFISTSTGYDFKSILVEIAQSRGFNVNA